MANPHSLSPSEHSLTIELPIRPKSAKRARDALRRLQPHLGSALLDAQLIVSELVADAVACAADSREMTLGAVVRDGWLHVTMSNGASVFALRPRPPEAGEAGWGMHLMRILSASWGLSRDGDAASVWFRVPLPEHSAPRGHFV
jgi:hypothetical protein